eukprot:scaffold2211_cov65-Phaeocystis_antarctica.AAC.8
MHGAAVYGVCMAPRRCRSARTARSRPAGRTPRPARRRRRGPPRRRAAPGPRCAVARTPHPVHCPLARRPARWWNSGGGGARCAAAAEPRRWHRQGRRPCASCPSLSGRTRARTWAG